MNHESIKRILFFILFAFISLSTFAQADVVVAQPIAQPQVQTMKFGYLSYNAALQAMPDYAIAQKNFNDLKSKYDEEAKRAEKEFNDKYEDFLEGQSNFPPTILQKRQSELQELMKKNIAFNEESRKLLEAAENDIYTPLHDKLAAILKTIGTKKGYAFIINTDNHACPFVNPAQGEDINQLVKDNMK